MKSSKPARRIHDREPPVPQGAEIVLKSSYSYEYCEKHVGFDLMSGMLILGNSQGLRWFSEYLLWMADRINDDQAFCNADPHDHQHLETGIPVNRTLSDGIFVTLGSYSMKNRRRVLKAVGITQARRRSGNTLAMIVEIIRSLRDLKSKAIVSGSLVADLEKLVPELRATIAKLKADAAHRESARVARRRSAKPLIVVETLA